MTDTEELLKIARSATSLPWEYKPAEWGEFGEPPISHTRVVVQLPELVFEGVVHNPQVEYVLTGNVDIADAIHIGTFNPKAVEKLLLRLQEAEATVERVEALCEEIGEGKSISILAFDREPEYPISYFQEALQTALDGP